MPVSTVEPFLNQLIVKLPRPSASAMEDVSRVKTESSSTVPDITGFPVGASFLLEIKLV